MSVIGGVSSDVRVFGLEAAADSGGEVARSVEGSFLSLRGFRLLFGQNTIDDLSSSLIVVTDNEPNHTPAQSIGGRD